MAKIDNQGNYLPFYGYTVLSMLDEKPNMIEEYIRKTKYLSRHVMPLPASSYHVTLFRIFTYEKVPKKYKPKSGKIPKNAWIMSNTLHRDLAIAQKKCMHVKEDIILTKKSLSIDKRFGHPLWFTVSLSNGAEITDLRKTCSKIFGKEDPLEFHVTLGYIFHAIGEDVTQEIDEELGGLWELVQDSYLLQKPDVYLFSSMERYIPFGQSVRNGEEEDSDHSEDGGNDSNENDNERDDGTFGNIYGNENSNCTNCTPSSCFPWHHDNTAQSNSRTNNSSNDNDSVSAFCSCCNTCLSLLGSSCEALSVICICCPDDD